MRNKSPLSGARNIRLSFTLAAVIYLALGILLVAAPNTSRRMLCTLVGVGVTAYGAFNILSFVLGKGEKRLTPELLIGVCAAAFGVFSLVNPTFLMDFLFTVMGVMVLVTGVATLRRALSLRSFGFAHWWAPLVCACICMLLALSVIFFPGLYGDMLMMAIGLILIAEAVDDLITLFALSRCAKNRM